MTKCRYYTIYIKLEFYDYLPKTRNKNEKMVGNRNSLICMIFLRLLNVCRRQLYQLQLYLYCILTLFIISYTILETPTSLRSKLYDNEDDTLYDIDRYYSISDNGHFSLSYSYIIPNTEYCKKHNPYMIIFVPSKPSNVLEREAIRETYGMSSSDEISETYDVTIDEIVKVVFILGQSDQYPQTLINFEAYRYQDIVQIEMKDTYYNLALKVLVSYKWIDKYCSNVKYVLKVDDDVFLNVGIVLQTIHNIPGSDHNTVMGNIYNETQVLQVERDPKLKTAVTRDEFPLKRLPPYAQGTLYALSRDLLPNIIKTAQRMPYMHIEDVFLTGVVAGKILGANMVNLNGTSDWRDSKPDPCEFVKTKRLAQSGTNHELMRKIWSMLLNYKTMCEPISERPLL